MKVAGETFSFIQKEGSRRGKILNVSKLSGERTVTRQNSGESLCEKAPTGQFPILMCLLLNIKICGGMVIRFKNIQFKEN
jgi:hypothetical protein